MCLKISKMSKKRLGKVVHFVFLIGKFISRSFGLSFPWCRVNVLCMCTRARGNVGRSSARSMVRVCGPGQVHGRLV